MPTYEVVRGDTVWGLTRRAMTEQLGRVPTNREILEVVNRVQVPSGNVDLIRPGEQITIPVGPGYEGGDTPPAAGNAPGDFVVPPSAAGVVPPSAPGIPGGVGGTGKDTDEFRRFRELERDSYGFAPPRPPSSFAATPPSTMRDASQRFNEFFGDYVPGLAPGPGSMPMPNLARMSEQERNEYMALQALQGAGMAAGLGGLYAAGGGGAAAPAVAARTPFPTQASVAASRNPIPTSYILARPAASQASAGAGARAIPQAGIQNVIPTSTSLGFRIPSNAPAGAFGAIERRLLMGPGGYAY